MEADLKNYISYVEKQNHIPSGLLAAIAAVESGFKPFALNIDGKAIFPRSYKEALAVTAKALSYGITNIDLGIMQVNYRFHHQKFADIREMLHPKTNINYAGKLLSQLYKQHGNWHKAVRYYHCANAIHHRKYSRKVVTWWLKSTV